MSVLIVWRNSPAVGWEIFCMSSRLLRVVNVLKNSFDSITGQGMMSNFPPCKREMKFASCSSSTIF